MSSKLREALDKIGNISAFVTENCGNAETAKYMNDIISIVQEAVAEPLRNCDVGTAQEQAKRFDAFCYAHRSYEKGCEGCPLLNCGPCCELAWAQMPYETVKTNKTKTNKGE